MARLELRVICRAWLRDPKNRDRRDVYLFEVSAEGARNSLLYHTDAAGAQWLNIITFAKSIGAKVVPEPVGADSTAFVHPNWEPLVPEKKVRTK